MSQKARVLLAAVFVIVLIAAPVVYFRADNGVFSFTAFAMGSYVDQTLYGRKGEDAGPAVEQALFDLESRISWRKEQSAIYQLNHADGSPVPLDASTRSILETALAVSEESGGAFDPTIAPISWLWNFDSDPRLPSGEEIEGALPLVDYTRLSLGDDGATLPSGMAIDLGAAGKGAACDTAVEIYKQYGVKSAVIAVGGSIGLYGEKVDGLWRVSVRDPWGEDSMGVLELGEGFVSTSGSYEKTFEQDGTAYHHLLNPKTGYPAHSGLVSVTVYSAGGALSDCLSTACFVLGYEKSLPLLEHFDAEALFIDEQGHVTATPGLEGFYWDREGSPAHVLHAGLFNRAGLWYNRW